MLSDGDPLIRVISVVALVTISAQVIAATVVADLLLLAAFARALTLVRAAVAEALLVVRLVAVAVRSEEDFIHAATAETELSSAVLQAWKALVHRSFCLVILAWGSFTFVFPQSESFPDIAARSAAPQHSQSSPS